MEERDKSVKKRGKKVIVEVLKKKCVEVFFFKQKSAYDVLVNDWSSDVCSSDGKVMPATEPLVAEIGNRVWVRYGNLSAMDHHPIHLHGYNFKIIGSDGGFAPDPSVLMPETTVLVPVGAAKVIEFIANNPGDWVFHCHMTHHTINQMGPKFPNMLGVEIDDFDEKIQALLPGYKTFGLTGLHDMTQSSFPIPSDSIPTLGYESHFGKTVFGGMANLLKVREKTDNYKDPGPYLFPKNTSAAPATESDLMRDKITLPKRKT